MENGKMKLVYVINERSGRHFWNKIGVAFQNNDGSINVKLDAIPVGGEMQIRDYVPKDDVPAPPKPRREAKLGGRIDTEAQPA